MFSVAPTGQPNRRRADADNLAKGLLDALNDVLYVDDTQIQCLTSRRFEYRGERGFYVVTARGVFDFRDDVVHDDTHPPLMTNGRRVTR